jgi:hypothetical protein
MLHPYPTLPIVIPTPSPPLPSILSLLCPLLAPQAPLSGPPHHLLPPHTGRRADAPSSPTRREEPLPILVPAEWQRAKIQEADHWGWSLPAALAAGGARARPSAGGIRRRGLELTRCPPATGARARRSELTGGQAPSPSPSPSLSLSLSLSL